MKVIQKNDRLANLLIIGLSAVVFALVTLMRKVKLDIAFGFDTAQGTVGHSRRFQ